MMLKSGKSEEEHTEPIVIDMKKSLLLLIVGLVGVTLGGYMVTEGASNLATSVLVGIIGMTETKAITLIGLSIVAVGTSLPEMVTSLVAAKKGENEIAFGNLVGSNIFNILFILGLSGVFTPLGINGDVITDTFIMLGVTLVAVLFAITKGVVSKKEGIIFNSYLCNVYYIYYSKSACYHIKKILYL